LTTVPPESPSRNVCELTHAYCSHISQSLWIHLLLCWLAKKVNTHIVISLFWKSNCSPRHPVTRCIDLFMQSTYSIAARIHKKTPTLIWVFNFL
jgi:hypothetical protein